MAGARLDSSVIASILRMSKAAHDSPSSSQCGGIVGAFGSIPVARRQVTIARIIPPGVKSTRRVAMALLLSVGGKVWSLNPVAILAKSVRWISCASSSELTWDG